MNENMGVSPFAVPVVITADTRLTLEMLRVLMALYWFRGDQPEPSSFPRRSELSEICKIHPSNISHATKKLTEFGWLTKASGMYTLTIPNVISEMVELHKEKAQAQKEAMKRPYISPNIREMIFERDSYRCVKCSSYDDLCIDHRFPFSLGGSSEPDNLQTLCWDCNSKKGNRIEVAA